jgi:prevent-host-death family protein
MEAKLIGTNEARADLGRLIDAAHYAGEETIITKKGERRAVLVPYAWWKEQRAKLDPPDGEEPDRAAEYERIQRKKLAGDDD